MPRRVLPHLNDLLRRISGIMARYQRMLDDDLLFGAGVQMPQVATIFDRVGERRLHFSGDDLLLAELLTLIAARYGLEEVQVIGHGGYAIVLSDKRGIEAAEQRRVMRLVPDHHVRDIVRSDEGSAYPYDVRLDAAGEPIRGGDYPLILSDLFLVPRHTTMLTFQDGAGETIQAGGYPARMHCQLLPEVRAFNHESVSTHRGREAGDLLEAALATLGVSVRDAHGGNGGVLLDSDGQPLIYENRFGGRTMCRSSSTTATMPPSARRRSAPSY